ncbi:MAG TPA: GtrA family protein [Candidatus Alistipes pullicola]|nr:GtrA family protein [Candidatus Alistipes pullicola]
MGEARFLTRLIDRFYFPFLRRWVPLQTFRYAVCGGTNMAFDLFLYFILYNFVLEKEGVVHFGNLFAISSYNVAWMIVFPITFFTGFWLNRHVAFHSSPLKGHVQLFRYLLSVCGSILLNYLCMKLFVDLLRFYPTPSNALTKGISIVYSYLMQKHFSFRGCAEQ